MEGGGGMTRLPMPIICIIFNPVYTPFAATFPSFLRKTHDGSHYDHLEVETVKAIGNEPLWYVPLGIGEWLTRYGINVVST